MNHSDLRAKAPSLAASMAAADHSPDIQLSQTRHRAALVASWHITPGSTVLELGCGQGDMTAVLAEAVGPNGRVVAIDVADPSYGTPVTLENRQPGSRRALSGRASTSASAPTSSTDQSTSPKVPLTMWCSHTAPGTSHRSDNCETHWPGYGRGRGGYGSQSGT